MALPPTGAGRDIEARGLPDPFEDTDQDVVAGNFICLHLCVNMFGLFLCLHGLFNYVFSWLVFFRDDGSIFPAVNNHLTSTLTSSLTSL